MRDKIGRAILYGFCGAAILGGGLGLINVLALGAPTSSLLVAVGALLSGIALWQDVRRIPPAGSG